MCDWTRNEDEKLIKAYRSFKGNWEQIATLVNSDKNAKECMQRIHKISTQRDYTKFTASGANWSSDVDKKINSLYELYGSNWTIISKHIPGKAPKQIRDRF